MKSRSSLPSLVAVAGDLFGFATGLPSAIFSEAVKSLLRSRIEEAQRILIEELEAGRPGELLSDDSVAVMFRYARAAREGTARVNLRIMAKVIANGVASEDITANRFHQLAGMIESLSIKELVVLGSLYRHWREAGPEAASESGNRREAAAAVKELVPAVFETNQDFAATCAAVSRTGLLVPVSLASGASYSVSTSLTELVRLADIEEAIDRERR